MSDRNYWLNLYTGATWEDWIKSDASASSFRERFWKRLNQVKKGDYLIGYCTPSELAGQFNPQS